MKIPVIRKLILLKKMIVGMILVSSIACPASAQQKEIDSLQQLLASHPQADTAKVNIFSELAFNYYLFNDADKVISCAEKGLVIANSTGFTRGKADCIKQLGIAYYMKNEYGTALKYDQRALDLYEQLDNKKGIASALNNMAIIYHNQAYYGKALEYYKKSMKMREEMGDEKAVAASSNNIGNTYGEMGNYTEALLFLLRGLRIREKGDDLYSIANSQANVANIYYSLGKYQLAKEYSEKSLALNEKIGNKDGMVLGTVTVGGVYHVLHDYTKALMYFNKALQLSKELDNPSGVLLCLNNLGETYLELHQYNRAGMCYQEALKLSSQTADQDAVSMSNSGVGTVYLQTGKVKESIPFLTKGYEIAMRTGAKLRIMEDALHLSKAYEALKDYENAFRYHQVYSVFEDSIFNDETRKKTAYLEFDYELNKKQKEIALLEKDRSIQAGLGERQKLISIALATGLTLLFFIAFILYRSRQKEKQAKEVIYKQKEEIEHQARSLTELNQLKDKTFSILSHDLRSPVASLSAVMSLFDQQMITPEEFLVLKKDLNKQLSALGLLLDNLLHWSKSQMQGTSAPKKEPIHLQDIVQQNFNVLHEAASQKQINLVNNIHENLIASGDHDLVDIVIRNLISNAIKFTDTKGQVIVSAKGEHKQLVVSVTDTGVGISQDQLKKLFASNNNYSTPGTEGEKGTGLGLMLCKEFVEKNSGTISVTSERGKGSIFSFSLPEA